MTGEQERTLRGGSSMCKGPGIAGSVGLPRKGGGWGGRCMKSCVVGDETGKVVRGQVQAGLADQFRDFGFCFKDNLKLLKCCPVCLFSFSALVIHMLQQLFQNKKKEITETECSVFYSTLCFISDLYE